MSTLWALWRSPQGVDHIQQVTPRPYPCSTCGRDHAPGYPAGEGRFIVSSAGILYAVYYYADPQDPAEFYCSFPNYSAADAKARNLSLDSRPARRKEEN